MQSLDYPGTPATEPGVLAPDGRWSPLPGDEPPDELVAGRTCVLAVGSNASPGVLHAKLARAGVTEPVPLVPRLVHGLDVAHSAHVSLGGYLPVSPCRCPPPVGRVATLRTDPQLAALLPSADPAATVVALREPGVRSAVNARLRSPAWSVPTALSG